MKTPLKIKQRPTQRAATVLDVKVVAVFYSIWKEKSLHAERLLVAHHSVEDGEEFSHTGSEGYLLEFASF